jgi:hypothetical protein
MRVFQSLAESRLFSSLSAASIMNEVQFRRGSQYSSLSELVYSRSHGLVCKQTTLDTTLDDGASVSTQETLDRPPIHVFVCRGTQSGHAALSSPWQMCLEDQAVSAILLHRLLERLLRRLLERHSWNDKTAVRVCPLIRPSFFAYQSWLLAGSGRWLRKIVSSSYEKLVLAGGLSMAVCLLST